MEAIFVYILEYMLTLVSLDKMQNISTFKHKSSKSKGRAFKNLLTSSKAVLFWWIICVISVHSHLFIAALWSPAGKGLTSWLSFVVLNCEIVTVPFGILCQVWYLIVTIHDLCPHS